MHLEWILWTNPDRAGFRPCSLPGTDRLTHSPRLSIARRRHRSALGRSELVPRAPCLRPPPSFSDPDLWDWPTTSALPSALGLPPLPSCVWSRPASISWAYGRGRRRTSPAPSPVIRRSRSSHLSSVRVLKGHPPPSEICRQSRLVAKD